jgi:hypothetical protein
MEDPFPADEIEREVERHPTTLSYGREGDFSFTIEKKLP